MSEVKAFARQLVDTLPSGRLGLFNPWADNCQFQSPGSGPQQRFDRLVRHLDCDPALILIGEAPGYQGCRYSGVAFTSERLLGEGAIPRIEHTGRLSTRRLPFSEPSATIVWRTLFALGLAERTILWNALQLHPHPIDRVWKNRTPTDAELELGQPAVDLLVSRFSGVPVIAVGEKAADLLAKMRVSVTAKVRHPANGGATKFSSQLEAVIRR